MPYLLVFGALLVSAQPFPQHRVKTLIEVPVQIGVGYEWQPHKHVSFGVQSGFLSEPNTSIILFALEQIGLDEETRAMIEDSFRSGVVVEGGLNYNFKKNYAGVFYQSLFLTGKETRNDGVEEVMGVDLTTYPRLNRFSQDRVMTLKSHLSQIGILYGRRIPFKNRPFEIDLEIGFSKKRVFIQFGIFTGA